MTRRSHKPTAQSRQIAETLSGYGLPQADICRLIGVSLPTLHRHYRNELDNGLAKAKARVTQRLFELVTQDQDRRVALAASIFFLKTQCGWSEFRPPPRQPDDQPPTPPLGKKAQAMAEAMASSEDVPEWGKLVN